MVESDRRTGKLIVTVSEPATSGVLARIATLPDWIDGVELRADAMTEQPDLHRIAAAVRGVSIFTRRGGSVSDEVDAVLEAGFTFCDVDLSTAYPLDWFASRRERLIVSYHDFDSFPDMQSLVSRLRDRGAVHAKLAVTPSYLEENLALLRIASDTGDVSLSVVGMGARGLYSRVLAPVCGSEFAFLAPSSDALAAPGQITIEQARAIYGSRGFADPAIFAIVGNPAHHSRSPEIHNRSFAEAGVDAIYTFCEVESFDEVGSAMMRGDRFAPLGVSITAPFKEDALRFARAAGATISENASSAAAVNTLVRMRREDSFELIADNTDVDGFTTAIKALEIAPGSSCAVAGAGGTARAALVALGRAKVEATVFNRSPQRTELVASTFGVRVRPLDEISSATADLLIDTLPAGIIVALPRCSAAIVAAYADPLAPPAARLFGGLDLLHAQAIRQSQLFIAATRALSHG